MPYRTYSSEDSQIKFRAFVAALVVAGTIGVSTILFAAYLDGSLAEATAALAFVIGSVGAVILTWYVAVWHGRRKLRSKK